MSQLNWTVGFDGEPITSARDPSRQVYERRLAPEGTPAAGVLVLHGFFFHSGWYTELAEGLCKDSRAVVHGLDLPSHGKSDDIDGLRMYAKEPEDFIDEVEAALLRLRDSVAPGTPLFLLGDSFGGLLALLTVLRPGFSEMLKGVVLCSPLVRIQEMSMPLAKSALSIGRRLAPEWVLPEVMSKADWDKMFGDAEAASFSKEDPLSGCNAVVRYACGALIMDLSDDLEQRLNKLHLDNLLVLHKELDHRSSISNSELIMKKATVFQRKELVRLPGEGHAVFGDIPERRTTNIQKIASFIKGLSNAPPIEGAVEQSKPDTREPAAPVRVIKAVKSQARDSTESEPGFEVVEPPSPVAGAEQSAASNGVQLSAVQDAKSLAATGGETGTQVFHVKQVTSKPTEEPPRAPTIVASKPMEETPQAPPNVASKPPEESPQAHTSIASKPIEEAPTKRRTIVVVKSARVPAVKVDKLFDLKTPVAEEWRAGWKSPRRSGRKNSKRQVDLEGIDMQKLERFNFAMGHTTSITSRIEDIPRETPPPPPVDAFWKGDEAPPVAEVRPVDASSTDVQSGVDLDDKKLARVSMMIGKEPPANGTFRSGDRPTSAYLKALSRNNRPQGPAISSAF
eukprot:CAMPEP_0184745188 /NCGR_PEP_ID=MMETSP0315-20130426/7853_1 /TAXON_ID=101924 /ORGANISM="Rhodosorus marinus, Strain UTEX LB 2760" /LENGTH=622 /DNA_ID=CAMNT_0027217211 /DNA_START=18 /DNA_END=1886 /DNA_ORIENTATION=-